MYMKSYICKLLSFLISYAYSVFEGAKIPYPKREFITDEEAEEKDDTGASKVGVRILPAPYFM